VAAQTVEIQQQEHRSSLRGLSVVSDRVVWASGSNGTVGLTVDSGITWKWMTVTGYAKTDFRDIEAFDETTGVIMGTTTPACVLRTYNAGSNWKVAFTDTNSSIFLDAMEFWNINSGILVGDPVNGNIFILRSFDGGRNWRGIPTINRPKAKEGEALFAASGTVIRRLNNQEAVFITGGISSRLFIRDQSFSIPITQGKASTGAFSIGIKDKKTWVIVGGNYELPDRSDSNCVITLDGGKTWQFPTRPPLGYLSCVEYISEKKWIACGPGGVYISDNDGKHWKQISREGFHVCRKSKNGKIVFLAGSGGRTARLKWQ